MPYVENIKVGSGETWPVRDKEAHDLIKDIWSVVYPVGSIYMSANNVNPGVLFGGSWEQIQDKFLLAAGSTYAGGTTGGEAEHELTWDEMPKHSHVVINEANKSAMTMQWSSNLDISGGSQGGVWVDMNGSGDLFATHNAGSSSKHNNMPPYLTVYMW